MNHTVTRKGSDQDCQWLEKDALKSYIENSVPQIDEPEDPKKYNACWALSGQHGAALCHVHRLAHPGREETLVLGGRGYVKWGSNKDACWSWLRF